MAAASLARFRLGILLLVEALLATVFAAGALVDALLLIIFLETGALALRAGNLDAPVIFLVNKALADLAGTP